MRYTTKLKLLLLLLVVTLATTTSSLSDFTLRHVELKTVKLSVVGGNVALGGRLITDKSGGAVLFYVDGQWRLRTRSGDYCITEQGGYLALATCGGNGGTEDFQYIGVDNSYYSLVLPPPRRSTFATWQIADEKVFDGRGFIASRNVGSLKDAFGAGWEQEDI